MKNWLKEGRSLFYIIPIVAGFACVMILNHMLHLNSNVSGLVSFGVLTVLIALFLVRDIKWGNSSKH